MQEHPKARPTVDTRTGGILWDGSPQAATCSVAQYQEGTLVTFSSISSKRVLNPKLTLHSFCLSEENVCSHDGGTDDRMGNSDEWEKIWDTLPPQQVSKL